MLNKHRGQFIRLCRTPPHRWFVPFKPRPFLAKQTNDVTNVARLGFAYLHGLPLALEIGALREPCQQSSVLDNRGSRSGV
jgi:hypothetical protein